MRIESNDQDEKIWNKRCNYTEERKKGFKFAGKNIPMSAPAAAARAPEAPVACVVVKTPGPSHRLSTVAGERELPTLGPPVSVTRDHLLLSSMAAASAVLSRHWPTRSSFDLTVLRGGVSCCRLLKMRNWLQGSCDSWGHRDGKGQAGGTGLCLRVLGPFHYFLFLRILPEYLLITISSF